jgi:hypothetical protein
VVALVVVTVADVALDVVLNVPVASSAETPLNSLNWPPEPAPLDVKAALLIPPGLLG